MNQLPFLSVSMITYQAEAFIAEAIEGVLNQQADFPIELVIGDDCSKDRTRAICAAYAEKYPDIIRVLPPESNLGIAANTARTMGQCRGKYIAVCDGDDIWIDPCKLQKQVAFLERNPGYGAVYTDVETIAETGAPVHDPEQEQIRAMYTQGDVFFKLLEANFINNSTAVFRRELIADHVVYPDRTYQIPDHIRWLHIATKASIHFMDYKSTAYRKHQSGLSVQVPKEKIKGNRSILRRSLYNIILTFHRHHRGHRLNREEQTLVFRRMCSVAFRPHGNSWQQRWQIIRLLPKYFPGLMGLWKIAQAKLTTFFFSSFKTMLLPDYW